MALGVVEIKLKSALALTLLVVVGIVAVAETVAGPALEAQIIACALPLASVVAAAALSVPRVAAKLTVVPTVIGALFAFQLTMTGTLGVQGAAAIGTRLPAVGAVTVNC